MRRGTSDILMSIIFFGIFFIFSGDLTAVSKLTWMDFIFLSALFGIIDGVFNLIFKN